jgi:cell wall-associated NlpC family hydrolase
MNKSRLGALAAVALSALTAACATSTAISRPIPAPGERSAGMSPAISRPNLDLVVRAALDLRGTPYRNGGADPTGFDCSGFTQYVFAQSGTTLPREVRDQFKLGQKVSRRKLAPGDLLFFKTTAHGASHVGIAIGDDEFVHAPSFTGVVRVEHLSASYWSKRFIAARRIL